jgi:hypothetical protein
MRHTDGAAQIEDMRLERLEVGRQPARKAASRAIRSAIASRLNAIT